MVLSKVVNIGQGASALADLISELEKNEKTLHLTARRSLTENAPDMRLIVVVDQFEEVFTLCRKDELREALVSNLLYAAKVAQGQTLVLLTMRADFYGKCAANAELAAALSDHNFLVGPMTDEELRCAVERPVQLVGCEFDAGLVDLLVQVVRNQPGALPLLQHALLEVWNKREGRRLTVKVYQEIGKLEGALQRRADATLKAFSEEEQDLCRRTFLRLTQPGEGTEDTKRRASMQELLSLTEKSMAEEAIIQKLADASLLTTEGDLSHNNAFVEVAHEALIRNWPQLRKWIDVDRAGLRTRTRLSEAARDWVNAGRDVAYFYSGARLVAAAEWASSHPGELSVTEAEFLRLSLEAQKQREASELETARRLARAEAERAQEAEKRVQAEAERAAEAERRVGEQNIAASKLRRRAVAAAAAAGAALILLTISVIMWRNSESATVLAKEQAQVATVQRAAAELTVTSADRNILFACQLVKDLQGRETSIDPLRFGGVVSLLDRALKRRGRLEATHWNYERPASNADVGDLIPVGAVAYSPDGKVLALGDSQGRVRILRDGILGDPIPINGRNVRTLAFAPDSNRVAIGTRSGISILNLRAPSPAPRTTQLEYPGLSDALQYIWSCSWNEKGDLAAACEDGKVYIWMDLSRALEAGTFPAAVTLENRVWQETIPVHAVAWDHNGGTLAIGDAAGNLRIWDGRALSQPIQAHSEPIWSLAWSRDGRLACGSWDQSISIWKLDRSAPGSALSRLVWKMPAHDQWVRDVTWIDGDEAIASVGDDGLLKLWNSFNLAPLDSVQNPAKDSFRLSYSASTKTIATADHDGAVRLTTSLRLGRRFTEITATRWFVSLSSIHRSLVSMGTARLIFLIGAREKKKKSNFRST